MFETKVRDRLKAAYRPSTLKAHRQAVISLAMFTLYYDVSFPVISIFTLLSFIEFLLDNKLSVPTVKNYVSSIKSAFKTSNVPITAFESPQLTLALSSPSPSILYSFVFIWFHGSPSYIQCGPNFQGYF
jgi:hypothetical protein